MTSLTVVVPMTIRRRGGRKQIVGPDGVPIRASVDAAETRGDPALVKALARAFRWRRMLEDGHYASVRELAAKEGVDRAYVGRVLNLTLLAPDVVEAILDGRAPEDMTATSLPIAPVPAWESQRPQAAGQASPLQLYAGKPTDRQP
ncbi:hypothetical protein [Falsiroseomonas sp.]|uniref:hypothetical protein n=1 Tax=Falsiroseomonas sp. TaxID=2870721 RepID=UPI0034A5C7AF